MIKQLIKQIIPRRHFWRNATFSEVGRLYTTRVMRTIAVSLGGATMVVFMLKTGYSIVEISLFWVGFYVFRAIISLFLAQIVADMGPKRAILLSNFLYIPSIIAFVMLPQFGVPVLIITAVFQAVSIGLYDTAHLVDFSRVKSADHVGSEVAFMNIVEKLAKGLAPLIGGLLAAFFDPRAALLLSILFFALAAQPLLGSGEKMKTGFRLAPKGFPWKLAARSMFVEGSIGFDIYASGTTWTLFLASTVFYSDGNQAYAQLGIISSLVLLVSLATVRIFGKLIDKRAGGKLLVWSALANIILNIIRAFAKTPTSAIGANIVNEVATTGYTMPFMRGMFDIADRTGYRVFYIGMMQVMTNVGSAIGAVVLACFMALFDVATGFTIFFLITGLVVSIIALSRFSIYSYR